MGESVAQVAVWWVTDVKAVLRLSCLGSALLPHLEGFTVHRPADPPVDTAAVQQTIPIVQHDEPGRRNVADSCCLGQPPRLEPGETEEIVVPHEPEGPPFQEQQQAEPGRDVTVDGVEPIQEVSPLRRVGHVGLISEVQQDDDPPALFFCHGTDAGGQMEAQQASTLPEPTSAVEPSPPVRPVKRLDRKTTQGQNVATPFAGASSSRTKRIVPPLRPTRRRTLPTQSGVTNLREKANNGNRRSASLKSTRRTRRSRSPPKRRGPAPARPAAVHAALDSNAAIASALREIALQLSRRRPSLTGLPENDDVVGQQVILKEERLEPAVVPPVVHVTVTRPAATIEVVNASVSTEETTDAEESSSPAQNEKPCDAGPNPSSAEQQQQQQVAVDTGPSIETLMHERECSTSHQLASVVEAVAGGPVHDDKCPVEVSRMLETTEPESVEHISARMSMTDACTTLHADDNDKAVPEAGVAKDLLANVPASDDADDDYAADEFVSGTCWNVPCRVLTVLCDRTPSNPTANSYSTSHKHTLPSTPSVLCNVPRVRHRRGRVSQEKCLARLVV